MSDLNSSLQQLTWLLLARQQVPQEQANIPQQNIMVTKPEKPIVNAKVRFKDPNKPPLSYTQLIHQALVSSPHQKCTLHEIYTYITNNYEYYKNTRNLSWKNSIRHNLSVSKVFQKETKPNGEKTFYWILNPNDSSKQKEKKFLESQTRINPLIKKMFKIGETSEGSSHELTTSEAVSYRNSEEFSGEVSKRRQTEQRVVKDLMLDEEEDISGLRLFASQDLTASFKKVYEELFPNQPNNNINQRQNFATIALEAAGVSLTPTYEKKEDNFMHQLQPASYSSESPSSSSNHTFISSTYTDSILSANDPEDQFVNVEDDSDDEFDWSRIT